MRRMVRSSVVAIAVAILSLGVAPQAHACGIGGDACPPPPFSNEEGVGYFYSRETSTFYPKAETTEGSESEPSGPTWMTKYIAWCDVGDPTTDASTWACGDLVCTSDGKFGYLTMVFRRLGASDVWELWPGRDRECRVTDEEPIALEEVEDEIVSIIEQHYEQIARPAITLTPADNALVNVPVLAETPDAGVIRFEVENPLPGYVEATPAYNWAWSNGASASGAGRIYDGTDPIAEPGHYPVRATYASSGIERVSLSAAWQIVFTVDGIPPITDIAPLVYEAAADFPVRSARTVLVD